MPRNIGAGTARPEGVNANGFQLFRPAGFAMQQLGRPLILDLLGFRPLFICFNALGTAFSSQSATRLLGAVVGRVRLGIMRSPKDCHDTKGAN